MDEITGETLREVIERHGRDLVNDPRRCRATLSDAFPKSRAGIDVLVDASEEVGRDLRAISGQVPQHQIVVLATRVEQRRARPEDLARWAVCTWLEALGVERMNDATTSPEPDLQTSGRREEGGNYAKGAPTRGTPRRRESLAPAARIRQRSLLTAGIAVGGAILMLGGFFAPIPLRGSVNGTGDLDNLYEFAAAHFGTLTLPNLLVALALGGIAVAAPAPITGRLPRSTTAVLTVLSLISCSMLVATWAGWRQEMPFTAAAVAYVATGGSVALFAAALVAQTTPVIAQVQGVLEPTASERLIVTRAIIGGILLAAGGFMAVVATFVPVQQGDGYYSPIYVLDLAMEASPTWYTFLIPMLLLAVAFGAIVAGFRAISRQRHLLLSAIYAVAATLVYGGFSWAVLDVRAHVSTAALIMMFIGGLMLPLIRKSGSVTLAITHSTY